MMHFFVGGDGGSIFFFPISWYISSLFFSFFSPAPDFFVLMHLLQGKTCK